MARPLSLFVLLLLLVLLLACSSAEPQETAPVGQPTIAPIFREKQVSEVDSPSEEKYHVDVQVHVDVNRSVHAISPFIYGLSGGEGGVVEEIRPTLMSWGGNPSTRYNWRIGHAWNAARDWFYRNGNYGTEKGSASDSFISGAAELGAEVRLAVPTLGWVAKNDDQETCSFPDENGECTDGRGASCDNPIAETDPEITSVRSTADDIVAWIKEMQSKGLDVRFFAMDNEPELWGYTHYDVHLECTTYNEILEKYLTYAGAVREVAPEAELTGPVTCCWYYYWNSAAGYEDKLLHGNQAFLPWFLEQVREHDEAKGVRTLDVLDLHYYPEGLYNSNVDDSTAAHRLRSTRSLWDKTYISETWIGEPIYLIPRMKELIEKHYPGTKLGISEWNWGADDTVNGALAIADVLGIFGREGLYFAAYWRAPNPAAPGVYAFRMYTNYDGTGSRFGDTSVLAESDDATLVSSYAALDSETGNLHLMLISKQRAEPTEIQVHIDGFSPSPAVEQYRYDRLQPDRIVQTRLVVRSEPFTLTLPPYSISLLVMTPEE